MSILVVAAVFLVLGICIGGCGVIALLLTGRWA